MLARGLKWDRWEAASLLDDSAVQLTGIEVGNGSVLSGELRNHGGRGNRAKGKSGSEELHCDGLVVVLLGKECSWIRSD